MPTSPSLPPRWRLPHAAGGSLLPAVLVLAALAVSATIFFFITRPALQNKKKAADVAAPAAPTPAAAATPETKGTAPKKAAPKTPAVAAPAKPPVPNFGFARPLDLGKEMLRSLTMQDFTKAGSLAAAADPAQAESAAKAFEAMMKKLGAKPGREDQVELLGLVENKTRVSIPLQLPGQETPARIHLDLERDDRMGWKITQLHVPKELSAALVAPEMAAAAAPQPASPPAKATAPSKDRQAKTPGAKGMAAAKGTPKAAAKAPRRMQLFTVQEQPDALTFGSDFVQALLRHDFVTARTFVDEKRVSAERLAGLCIVFEEGKYEFKPNKPLIITIANPEVSWVIAQVQSPSLQQSTEFGLELQRPSVDQPWRVVGLNLSEILSSFASAATKMGVPYTPIVNNPSGGESLALYFEYDRAELHPRAQKQLAIVADLLKSDPSRSLQIAGHTDAKGPETYNMRLSQARAESVKEQLVSLGVASSQIVTTGLGKAQPLGPNEKADGTDNPEGRSKNRRAEIYLDF